MVLIGVIDMGTVGKNIRQGHLDTWKSNHSFDDIRIVRKEIKEKILVDNPWNNNSIIEINIAIEYGADTILPMIINFEEIYKFCGTNSRIPVNTSLNKRITWILGPSLV